MTICYKEDLRAEMIEKNRQEILKFQIRRDYYIADCLWALASGFSLRDKDGNPALKRLYEIINPQGEEATEEISKEIIKAHFKRLKSSIPN